MKNATKNVKVIKITKKKTVIHASAPLNIQQLSLFQAFFLNV
ncbi:hypothetical protein NSA03_00095 [Lactobacillus taiwanensis]|nr:hypothetical protein [Lactobacillus taiwanensis]MCR1915738.1 hypothetical protein [Lactobacillus taiwanensis]